MYVVNDKQNQLERYIKELKRKTKPSHHSNLRKVKKTYKKDSVMTLPKGREMVFKAF